MGFWWQGAWHESDPANEVQGATAFGPDGKPLHSGSQPQGPIPNFTFSGPGQTTSASNVEALNEVASTAQERQQMIAAENASIPIPYGRVSSGALIADVVFYNGALVILAVWGHGPVNSIEAVYLDDLAPAAGVTVTSHDGTQVVPDSTLVAAYAAQSPPITYADVMPNIAYSVITLPLGVTSGFPRITAVIQGVKTIYDPRGPSTGYSDNPALVLADLQVNTVYGAGGLVDWTSVGTAATACDAAVAGGEKRRTIGLLVDNPADIGQWFEALRAYAGCFLTKNGALLTLTPDRPASSTYTFSEAVGASQGATCRVRNVKRRSKRDVPTVSAIRYTDASVYPWRDRIAYAYAPGVLAGTVPWKIREVAMPGITRSTQALREAIEQLNKLSLNDLTLDVDGSDESLTVTIGDVVTVTANLGITARSMRVLGAQMPKFGRPIFNCEGYDPAAYSDSVVAASAVVDTSLPNPNSVAAPTALVISETVYLEQVSGSPLAGGLIYQSRFDCTWTPPAASVYQLVYRVELWDGGTVKIRDEVVSSAAYSSPAVQQGKTYTVKVYARNPSGVESAALTGAKAALGKLLPPGPVPAITEARELGGDARLAWTAAIDIDVMRYEWRYFPNGTGTWATATFIDRIDGLRATFKGLPVGTHRFYVRPIDSVGQYSLDAAANPSADITITSDANAFLLDRSFSNPLTVVSLLGDDFSSGTGWTLATGVTISAGHLNIAWAGPGATSVATKSIGVKAKSMYGVTFDIVSFTSGDGVFIIAGTGGASSAKFNAPGSYNFILDGSALTPSDDKIVISCNLATTCVIDNLAVYEIANLAQIPSLEGSPNKRWATAVFGDSWTSAEPNPFNSGGNPVLSYHASGTSRFQGESWDLGSTITGDWTLTPNTTVLGGSVSYYFETSPDGTTWTRQPGISWKGGTRFIRPIIEALTTSTFQVDKEPNIRLAALSKPETGQVQCLASGGKLVQLTGKYSGAQDLQATAINTGGVARTIIFDRVLLNPQSGLMLVGDSTAGDAFLIQEISTTAYVIQANDFLEYDLFVDPSSPAALTLSDGGLTLRFSDATTTGGINDADGYDCVQPAVGLDALARGVWKSRKVSLATRVGKTTANWRVRNDGDGVGTHKTLFRNIRITNVAPSGQPTVYGTTGDPSTNSTFASALTTNIQCGPSNSFYLYAFNAAGTQVAQTGIEQTQYAFRGF